MANEGLEPVRTRDPQVHSIRPKRDIPDSPLLERVQKWILHHSLEHLHGPEKVDYDEDELVVLCLLRNGRQYVKSFVEHYVSLGVKHIVFLDNGSTDGTVEALQSYEEGVTVLQSRLPFKRYQMSMKQYLVERFCRNRWSLTVDMDELFDYPYSDVVSLSSFLRYLSKNSYTAVVAQMLDMFPEEPLSDTRAVIEEEPLKELHKLYDISDVHAQDYFALHSVCGTGNVLSNDEVGILKFGIQATLFGENTPLTKHPLVFFDGKVTPMYKTAHAVSNARIADLTCVLYHYKFLGHFYERIRWAVREQNYMRDSYKHKRRLEILEQNSTLQIRRDTSRELKSVNELVDSGFLVVSEEYATWADAEDNKNGSGYGDESRALAGGCSKTRAEAQSLKAQQVRLQVERLQDKLKNKPHTIQRSRDYTEKLEEKLAAQRERAERLRDRAEKLAAERQRARGLEKENARLVERVRDLQRQIHDIQSSRAWRLLGVLGRIRDKVQRR